MAAEATIEDRRIKTIEVLSKQGFVSLAELVHSLGVSDSTVRRDLEILEEQGIVKRTHGGAVYIKDAPATRLAFADRELASAAEKRAIAAAVAELIAPNETIILDGGTTCHQIAHALRNRRLSVITNSVHIASLLSKDIVTEVTLIGGYVYPRTGVALGPTACAQLADLHAGKCVMSCAGLAPDGAYNANQMMAEVERSMMGIADEVILAADHSKLGLRGVVRLCELNRFDVIVTDDGADEATREWLARGGVRVIYATRQVGATQ